MSTRVAAQLAPVIGGFVAWMLSGSPVPMVVSVLLIFLAFLAGKLTRPDSSRSFLRLLFPCLALTAAIFQVWLFQTGLAMAISADLPLLFHLSLAMLWAAAMECALPSPVKDDQSRSLLSLCALAGSLAFLAASHATELYDFTYWQVYPLAALPFVLFILSTVSSKRSRWKFGLTAGIAAVAISALALTIDRVTDQLSDWMRDESDLADLESSPSPRFDSSAGGSDGSSRRLPRKASIRFDDRVRLFLKTGSPDLFRSWMREPLYLRTSTVTVFESDEIIAPVRSGRWIYDSDDGDKDNTIPIVPDSPSLVEEYTLFIERDAAQALPLLRGSQQVKTAALYEFADSWYQLAPAEETKRLRFTAATLPSRRDILTDMAIGSLRRPSGPGIYLNLPPSPLAARITRICDQFEYGQSVETIREHLRGRAQYSLDYETPEDMSPVESLLFGERRGHCELYAAASVLMLRSIDIPCRLAYGYTGGVADRRQKLIAFRDRDFHAWAEILAPDNQWIVFDATPTTGNATRRIPTRATVAGADWSDYENFSSEDTSLEEGDFSFLPGIAALTAFLSRHFLTLSWTGFGMAAFFWWVRQHRRRGEADLQSDGVPDSAARSIAHSLMAKIEGCGEQLGIQKKPGFTWEEYLTALQGKADLPECFPESIRYYYRVRYAAATADPGVESELCSKIEEWKTTFSHPGDKCLKALTN